MTRRIKRHREYRFEIDAYTKDTIPMARLAEYLRDLATMLGQEKSVHLIKIEDGSTVPVVRVEWEAEPKVRERIRAVKMKEAPAEAQDAEKNINRRLMQDNGKAKLVDPVGTNIIRFPGRERATQLEYGPISQAGIFQGVPIKVGGENDPVPVHLEDGKEKYIVHARRTLAKEIAQYLFSAIVRVEGTGRWIRHGDGDWEMLIFHASSYHLIEDGDIRKNIGELQQVPGDWKKMHDPIAALQQIRRGEKLQ
ncbi:MAG TPA: hypothetical protein VHA33_11635 [Candidatus Angelobacter sp.]|jgi:hypothetical protein|nr:hypothetical protein [Candidatus Angelobacter sp.]